MSLAVTFRREARSEFVDTRKWYENQRLELGAEFEAEVQITIDQIAGQPDRYPYVVGDVRQAPVSRFPFSVFYRIRRGKVSILSVFHGSRDPDIWKARV